MLFFYSFFRKSLPVYVRVVLVLYGVYVMGMILSMLVTGQGRIINLFLLDPGYLMILLVIFLFYPVLFSAVRNNYPYSKIVATGVLLFTISGVIQVLVLMNFFEIPSTVGEGYFIMNFMFAAVLGHRQSMLQKEVEQANQKLKSLDQVKDTFLASTSHELRTPLQAMLSLAEGINSDRSNELSEESRRDLELITASVRRLSRLVDDILDFSRIQNGHVKLEKRVFDVGSIIPMVLDMNRILAGNKKISLGHSIASDTMPVVADPLRTLQIIENLVSNAIKFQQENGRVEIIARNSSQTMVEIHVKNEGPEVTEDDRELIFQSFYQNYEQSTGKPAGSGLGLAISRDLSELQNGSLVYRRETDSQRNVFILTLPGKQGGQYPRFDQRYESVHLASLQRSYSEKRQQILEPVGGVSDRAPVKERAPGQERDQEENPGEMLVLLVEDDSILQHTTEKLLKQSGARVHLCDSGNQALSWMKENNPPDLIVLDVMLPGISGFETCRIIREKYPASVLPVLMITARSRFEDMIEGLNAGANDFLSRPFASSELKLRVSHFLTQIRLRKEIARTIEDNSDAYREHKQRLVMDLHDHMGARITDMKISIDRLKRKGYMDQKGVEILENSIESLSAWLGGTMDRIEDDETMREDYVTGIHLLMLRRYESAGRAFAFHAEKPLRDIIDLPHFQRLKQATLPIILEIVTNDLKFGEGESRWNFNREGEYMVIEFSAMSVYNPARSRTGRGTAGLQGRVAELNGHSTFRLNDGRFSARIEIPVE